MPSSSLPFSTTLILVRNAQQGDQDSHAELMERYLPKVRALVSRRLGSELRGFVEIEDVVQESMLDACKAVDQYQEKTDRRFAHWMARLVENNIRDLHRRFEVKMRQGFAPPRGTDSSAGGVSRIPAPGATPSQEAWGAELADAQCRALQEMHARYRKVFVLREVRGLSFEEIARELGYERPETVRVKLSAAKKQLRALMEAFLRGA